MTESLGRTAFFAITAASLWVAPASAQEQRMEGIIVTHAHGQLTVKTPSGNQTIALAPGVRECWIAVYPGEITGRRFGSV